MSKLYETVEKIIHADSVEEAKDILYGRDGIPINTKEHYQRIISMFIKKKELMLTKNGNAVHFDLDNNIEDIWDIVFISEFVQKQLNDLSKEIDKKLSQSKKGSDERKSLNEQKRKIKEYQDSLNKLNDIYVDSFKSLDNIKDQIEKLKRSIKIINDIRNSFSHEGELAKDDGSIDFKGDNVYINNPQGKIEIDIPIDYLDGFVKGRIIAQEQDKVIIEKTNNIVSPILKELGYDISKIESFFYNIDPNIINSLLEYFDDDITKVYQLPEIAFDYLDNTLLLLEQLSFYKIETKLINIFPRKTFQYPQNTLKLINEFSNRGISFDILYDLPKSAYFSSENTIELLKKLSAYEITPDFLTKLPNISFYKPKQTIKLLEELSERNMNFDLLSKLPKKAFENAENTLIILELLSQKNINTDLSLEMVEALFDYPDFMIMFLSNFSNKEISVISNHLKKRRNIVNYLRLLIITKVDPSILSCVPDDAFDYPVQIAELLVFFINNQIPSNVLKMIPIEGYINPKNTIELLKILTKSKINLNVLTKLPAASFNYPENTAKLVAFLLSKKTNPDILYYLFEESFVYVENTIKLLNTFFDYNINTELLIKLPDTAFINPENTIKLLKKFYDYGIDINNLEELSKNAFDYPEKTTKVLDAISYFKMNPNILTKFTWSFYYYPEKIIELFKALSLSGLNPEILTSLPDYAFDEIENIVKLLDLIDLYKEKPEILAKLPYNIFSHPNKTVQLFPKFIEELEIDITKLSNRVVSYAFSDFIRSHNVERLKKMCLDYNIKEERLDEYPLEFFTCDINILEELLQRYNSNIARSIFGVNNPKIISLMIYMNSVFRRYNVNSDDSKIQNDKLDTMKMFHNGFVNTMMYKDGIKTYEVNMTNYMQQFMKHQTMDDLKKELLENIRNASIHYRIKPVRDKEGNLVEDMVYLYDEDNYGNNNFNIVLSIEEAYRITREVEIALALDLDKDVAIKDEEKEPVKAK